MPWVTRFVPSCSCSNSYRACWDCLLPRYLAALLVAGGGSSDIAGMRGKKDFIHWVTIDFFMKMECLFSLETFSTSNNRQQNRRRKPWSQLLHCKMTRDSSTPWETLWQRSGAYDGYVAISWPKYNWVCVLSLVQLYANHGTVKHTKCDWRFETSMR